MPCVIEGAGLNLILDDLDHTLSLGHVCRSVTSWDCFPTSLPVVLKIDPHGFPASFDPTHVDDHSSESVGGIKKIEALGALKLHSGGSASLAAVDDLHQATGRDLNLLVGQRLNATVGGDMEERIQGLRISVSGVSQSYIAGKSWIGSNDVNALQVLCSLIDLVEQMNIHISEHVHASSPPPNNLSAFTSASAAAGEFGGKLRSLTL